ncbi:MAG: hypothetical protein II147_05175 [Lachnospiraceae bacterium]|nr:hypothetical protein [Lachnospiraceae bacterium]
MSDTFNLDGKEIVLYGAASIGNLAYDWFTNAGFTVVAFIDKRGAEIDSLRGIPVYSLTDECIKEYTDDTRYVVFVSVKNVFEHTNIANELTKHEFTNLIYRPISVINGGGTEDEKRLNEVYSLISEGKAAKIQDDLKKATKGYTYEVNNRYILEEDDDTVVTLVPVSYIYTDRKKRKTPWFDKPILALLPHIDLFRYINGESAGNYSRYMDYCIMGAGTVIEVTDAWKKNVIKNRSDIFEHMKHYLETDYDFFIRNAPVVTWNSDTRHFNLNSGKHRAAFFVSQKKHFMPVRMSKEDYKTYINEEAVDKVIEALSSQSIMKTEAVIEHPYLIDFPCNGKEFYYGLMYRLTYYIAEELYEKSGELSFENLRISAYLNDFGFLERILIRMGINLDVFTDYDLKLAAVIDAALHSDLRGHMGKALLPEYDYSFIDIRDNKEYDIESAIIRSKVAFVIVGTDSDMAKDLADNRGFTPFYSGIVDGADVSVLMKRRYE